MAEIFFYFIFHILVIVLALQENVSSSIQFHQHNTFPSPLLLRRFHHKSNNAIRYLIKNNHSSTLYTHSANNAQPIRSRRSDYLSLDKPTSRRPKPIPPANATDPLPTRNIIQIARYHSSISTRNSHVPFACIALLVLSQTEISARGGLPSPDRVRFQATESSNRSKDTAKKGGRADVEKRGDLKGLPLGICRRLRGSITVTSNSLHST